MIERHDDPDRGTGRTTRMLARAVEAAERGEMVVFVVANKVHGNQLRGLVGHKPKIEFRTVSEGPLLGLRPHYFVDHFAFGVMLELDEEPRDAWMMALEGSPK